MATKLHTCMIYKYTKVFGRKVVPNAMLLITYNPAQMELAVEISSSALGGDKKRVAKRTAFVFLRLERVESKKACSTCNSLLKPPVFV